METSDHLKNGATLPSHTSSKLKNSNTMKKIFTILPFALAINASAQQTPKTFTGPYSIGNNDGQRPIHTLNKMAKE